MNDIKLDRTRFRITHHRGLISIEFQPDDGSFAEPDAGCDRRHVFRRIVVDWDPSVAAAVEELDALPVPSSSLDPIVDRYLDIVETAFGRLCSIRSMTDDDRLLEQYMHPDRQAIQAWIDRRAA